PFITEYFVSAIRINLNDEKLWKNKEKLTNLQEKVMSTGVYDVLFVWEPSKATCCPTSVAKYFADCGYCVSHHMPSYMSSSKYCFMTPILQVNDNDDVVNFLEWLGMVALDGDITNQHTDGYVSSFVPLEGNKQYGQIKCYNWKGYFTADNIATIIKKIRQVLVVLFQFILMCHCIS
ncbi:unnamed protein product, partial [Callosobruchus maculatus]